MSAMTEPSRARVPASECRAVTPLRALRPTTCPGTRAERMCSSSARSETGSRETRSNSAPRTSTTASRPSWRSERRAEPRGQEQQLGLDRGGRQVVERRDDPVAGNGPGRDACRSSCRGAPGRARAVRELREVLAQRREPLRGHKARAPSQGMAGCLRHLRAGAEESGAVRRERLLPPAPVRRQGRRPLHEPHPLLRRNEDVGARPGVTNPARRAAPPRIRSDAFFYHSPSDCPPGELNACTLHRLPCPYLPRPARGVGRRREVSQITRLGSVRLRYGCRHHAPRLRGAPHRDARSGCYVSSESHSVRTIHMKVSR